MARYTRQERALTVREYAALLYARGIDIQLATRALYLSLGFEPTLRQRDMDDEQLDAVTDARIAAMSLLN